MVTSGWHASYWNEFLLPPTNEVWGKVIFSEACVKNSVQWGGVPGLVPPWDQVHTPLGPGTPPPKEGTPPREQCMLGDTGNKRAVRILLECILVLTM